MSVAKRMIFEELYPENAGDFTGEWNTKETVPVSVCKDGYWSEVIVWNLEHDRCELVRINDEREAFWGDWDIQVEFSHWMKLPERPSCP